MYSSLFVCVFGMVTMFIGLICIIVLVTVMGKICQSTDKKPAAVAPAVSAPAAAAAPADKAQLIAAVSAVIAEEMGTDVSGLRILSMKKI